MIVLNRIDGNEVLVNSDYIRSIENGEKTLVTTITGDKILVKESLGEVEEQLAAKSFASEYQEKKKEPVNNKKTSNKKPKKKQEQPQKNVSHEF